jgi:hypothetical protein
MATGHFSASSPSHAFVLFSECFVTLEIHALTFVQKHCHDIQFFIKVCVDLSLIRAFIVARYRPLSDQNHFVHEGLPLFCWFPQCCAIRSRLFLIEKISTWRNLGGFAANSKAALATYLSEAPNSF